MDRRPGWMRQALPGDDRSGEMNVQLVVVVKMGERLALELAAKTTHRPTICGHAVGFAVGFAGSGAAAGFTAGGAAAGATGASVAVMNSLRCPVTLTT
jgi:hypothetical protein